MLKKLFFVILFSISLFAATEHHISLQLSWFNQFQFAGYYIAKEKGFYKAQGLNVEIKPFHFGINVLKEVNTQKADFGVAKETLLAKNLAENFIILSAIFQASPLVLLTTKASQINSIEDFKHKRLMATARDANQASVEAMLISKHIVLSDINYIKHTHNIQDLINKKTDIISAYVSKSPFELQKLGIKYNLFDPKDYGFDMYSGFLFTTKKFSKNNNEVVSAFHQASLDGWKYAYNHIEETVDLILEKYNTQNLSREALIFEAQELKKLSYFKTKHIGAINKAKLQRIYDLYNLRGFVKKSIDLDSIIFKGAYHKPSAYEKFYKLYLTIGIILFFVILYLLLKNKKLKTKKEEFENNFHRLNTSLEGNQEGIFDWNIDKNSIFLSAQWKAIIGYKDEELLNTLDTWKDRIHQDDYHYVIDAIQKYLKNKSTNFENVHRLKHKDGHWIWIYARGICKKNEHGKPVRMIGTIFDITNDKEMQIKIQQQNQVIEEVHDSIITTDTDGYIKSWNHGSTNLLQYQEHEVLGKHIKILFSPDQYKDLEEQIATLSKDKHFTLETQFITKLQKTVYVELSCSTFKNKNGKLVGFIGYSKDISDRKRIELELEEQRHILHHQAHYDLLTNLPNRLLFEDRIEHLMERAKREQTQFALLFIDLDKFKSVNDSLGHEIGDKVLQEIAIRLKNSFRAEDTVARLSGDEFVAIVSDIKSKDCIESVVNKTLNHISSPIQINNTDLSLTASIGIAFYPDDDISKNMLIKDADKAMYKAKKVGNSFFYFDSLQNVISDK